MIHLFLSLSSWSVSNLAIREIPDKMLRIMLKMFCFKRAYKCYSAVSLCTSLVQLTYKQAFPDIRTSYEVHCFKQLICLQQHFPGAVPINKYGATDAVVG